MATWQEFAEQAPDIAELGLRIFTNYGIAYLGTIRADGGPRVVPVSPVVVGDRIYIGVMPDTPKRHDLDRDPRCVVHSLPGPMDAEVCLTGTARQVSAEWVETLIATAPPNIRFARDTFVYEIDLERVNCTNFDNLVPGRRPRPTRSKWTAQGVAA
ncbi:pyridoxamine 5'-phosphate oxidase family protein [Phytomonospora endophytica]|uniref:Pyridoxamine 5'-phosphate oxidase N-terminal domain-containing protein n=1 Tax=Phytomonospora endophytica TaxID=714109 RepID=A0A841FVR2_9ACTN|nr:pyridoxamine 5'-phosphate oxidase family protein [Phytomonospora endophytica]MBB6038853.1 hypothetical protein [Phytomonospora endophytica]GIG68352.1 hypothetical protein Pen01_46470 [Phytomonospora endophytica]